MKRNLIIIIIVFVAMNIFASTAEEYINSARSLENSNISKAVEIMEEANDKYPDNADVLSVYALMLSRQAGQVNFLKAGMISSKAEKTFEKALTLEPNHKNAILWRGILRVNLPKFLGKLDKGIADLEKTFSKADFNNDDYLVSSYFLGHAYLKKDDSERAKEFFNNVIREGDSSQFYEDSVLQLQKLTDKEPEED